MKIQKDKPPGGVQVTFEARNFQELSEGSPFKEKFVPDRWKAYVEFDICHSLPVIAGPTASTGNYVGYHPAVLERCHATLLHQQMNLHHMIKAYNPDVIERDHIVGAVVATHFPKAPEGGWQIAADKDSATPIRACGVVFRQAEDASKMLRQTKEKTLKWSVSIEVVPANWDSIGIYIPSQDKIVPLLEADEELVAAITQTERGQLKVGKYKGEQMVLAMGAIAGMVEFQGVGYTPRPAEAEAVIVQVLACGLEPDLAATMALSASLFPGSQVQQLFVEGEAKLPGRFWSVKASAENPCAWIKLANGNSVLRSVKELLGLLERRETLSVRRPKKISK